MKRFFIQLAYNGTRFCGWQRQPNAPSVQQSIEEKLSLLLQNHTEIIGCGRTDTGVHAKQYFAHFDTETAISNLQNIEYRLQKMVGNDIRIDKIFEVTDDQHARFSATSRSYEYHISFEKNIFETETTWYWAQPQRLDFEQMQAAAQLLRQFDAFAPFCKTHSDAQTMFCTLTNSTWEFADNRAVFHIAANRFLRGMVRLIVGACISVGEGQLSVEDLKKSLQNQTPLPKSYSVPPNGLFLTDIRYPFLEN
jgi:tRNA pseudouridine38-40 synthase